MKTSNPIALRIVHPKCSQCRSPRNDSQFPNNCGDVFTRPQPRADPGACSLAKQDQQAQRRQHHRSNDDAESGPRKLSARRQSCKLLLNDLKIDFDNGEIGARPDET